MKIQTDKLLHFIAGTYIYLIVAIFFCPLIALSVVAIAGLAKEFVYDKWMKKGALSGWI